MSSASINFSGISSGINTNAIVQEMLAIDQQPITQDQEEIKNIQNKETAYNTVSAALIGLQSAGQSLSGLQSFDLVTATSSTPATATVTAQTGAATGTHSLTVNTLAQAQRIAMAPQSSLTAPLGFSGQIVINGEAITVNSSDSLTTLTNDINAVNPGVTASIIQPSTNQYYLTLSSNNSGTQGAINISDSGSGTLLGSTLSLFTSNGATSLSNVVNSTTAGSGLFKDSGTSVGTLEGLTSPASGSVQITSNGVTQTVNVDLNDSLSQIASSINTAFGSTVATVAAVTNPITGAAAQQLQLTGVTSSSDLVDSNNVLANLGLVNRNITTANQLTAAQNATFSIDNISATSPTNTLSSVLTGVTINLVQGGGATTNFTVAPDTTTLTTNINNWVQAYNTAISSVTSSATYDPTSGATGILLGDSTTQNIVSNLQNIANGPVSGLPNSLSALSQIGITVGTNGVLSVDSTTLASALSSNLQGVGELFQPNGVATNPNVQFVSSGPNTQPSGASGYAINVTQPALQAVATAGTAMTAPLAQSETLSFGGPSLGTSSGTTTGGYSLTLTAGESLNDIISQINGDPTLSPILTASSVNNTLTLTSTQYGSGAEIDVQSNVSSSTPDSSGIGTSVITAKGTDIAGTINGEAATGSGQFLSDTSTASNAQAVGLQVRVTATTPGSYGTIAFTDGIGDQVDNFITTQIDPTDGALTTGVAEMNQNVTDIQGAITSLQASLALEQTNLETQFSNMEVTLSELKANGNALAELGGSTSAASQSAGTSSAGTAGSSTSSSSNTSATQGSSATGTIPSTSTSASGSSGTSSTSGSTSSTSG